MMILSEKSGLVNIFFPLIILLLVNNVLFAQRDPRISLIADYPFDGDASDISGNGYHGEINGPVPGFDRFGNSNSAFKFDGIDDYIKLPIDINPKLSPVITITIWVQANSMQNQPKVFSHDDGGFDRTIGIDERDGSEGWSVFTGTGTVLGHHPVRLGEWIFLAAVYDQAYEDESGAIVGRISMYVNDDTLYQEIGKVSNGLDYIYVGANPTFGHHFNGNIDHLKIYKGELTSFQIGQLYREANPNHNNGPEIMWEKHFSGIYNNDGRDLKIVKNDGGFILGASSYEGEAKGSEMKVIRTDSLGNLNWVNTFGTGYNEYLSGITDVDLGFIITGIRQYENLSGSLYLSYINHQGEELWAKTYGDTTQNNTIYIGLSVLQSEPGKYIVLGSKQHLKSEVTYLYDNDIWLMQVNELGMILWEKFIGGNYADDARSLIQTHDGGLLLLASFGEGDYDQKVWLTRMDNKGEIIWSNTYGSGFPTSVVQSSDGSFIVAYSNMLLCIDAFGDEKWEKGFRGNIIDFQQTKDDGFILLGLQKTYDWLGNGKNDVSLVKTDDSGETIWTKSIGGIGNDTAAKIKLTTNGGYVILGTTESFNLSERREIYLVKIAPEVTITGISDNYSPVPDKLILAQNFPNPFNPTTTIAYTLAKAEQIKITVYNISGQLVKTLLSAYQTSGNHNVSWDGTDSSGKKVSSGVYFYQLVAGTFNQVKKMTLIK
jgi:FlgD Ig-like domain/Concanavalin A-like lectin/glucanases superfamily